MQNLYNDIMEKIEENEYQKFKHNFLKDNYLSTNYNQESLSPKLIKSKEQFERYNNKQNISNQ